MTNEEIVELCQTLGVPIKGETSSLNQAYADMVRRRAERDGLTREVVPVEPQPPATPANSAHFGRRVQRRSLSVLHLQSLWTDVGRDALLSRQFLSHLRNDGHKTLVKTVVDDPIGISEKFAIDYLSPSEFIDMAPDAVTCEESLLVPGIDRLRIPSDLLERYLYNGGIVIVDGYGVHGHSFDRDGEPTARHPESWDFLQQLARTFFLDGKSPDHLGTRLRNSGHGFAEHPQISVCDPLLNQSPTWLESAFRNIGALHILDVRPIMTMADRIGQITGPARPIEIGWGSTASIAGPFVWGAVRQVGAGFLVIISGHLMSDTLVDGNPDNAIFLQQLIELLVGEVEREKELRGVHHGERLGPRQADSIVGSEIRALIKSGENRTVEFKSSAKHDLKSGEKNPVLEDEIAKQVAALWNSDGGDLLVGVSDDGTVTGIECDFAYLQAPTSDAWIRMVEDLLFDRTPDTLNSADPVHIATVNIDGQLVGHIKVPRGERPLWFRSRSEHKGAPRQERLYIRRNNSVRELNARQTTEYFKERFS